jgi:hypothetical protein
MCKSVPRLFDPIAARAMNGRQLKCRLAASIVSCWLAALFPSSAQDAATASPPAPPLIEEVWGLPHPLPSIAYVCTQQARARFRLSS